MNKWQSMEPRKWAQGVLISLGALFVGGILSFFLIAVPAALISQMYATIPVRLSTEMSISFGIGFGILFVYFDMGRGQRGNRAYVGDE